MRIRAIWILTIAILILLLPNSGLTFQNEPDGFRSLKWGDPPARNMRFVGKEKDELIIYKVSNERLSLGDAKFHTILYSFYGQPKRFMVVGLYFQGKKNFELLKDICKTKFGKPTGRGFFEFTWEGQIAFVFLIHRLVDDDGYLTLGSTIIFTEYTESKKKRQAKEAEKDW